MLWEDSASASLLEIRLRINWGNTSVSWARPEVSLSIVFSLKFWCVLFDSNGYLSLSFENYIFWLKVEILFQGGFYGDTGGEGKGRYLFKINPRVGWDHSVRHIGWIDRYWLSNPKATGTSTGRLGLIQFHTGICILHIKQILGSILTFKEISLVGKWKILRGLNLQWQRKCFAPLSFEGLILRYFCCVKELEV